MYHHFFRCSLVAAASTAALLLSGTAHAQIGYSNQENFIATYVNGNATLDSSGSGVTTTNMIADDIIPIASGIGQSITGCSFTVANNNATTVRASVLLQLYADNNGVPGTRIGGFSTSAITFGANSLTSYDFTSTPGFPIASLDTIGNGKFWAGLAFRDYDFVLAQSTGATAAQLNNLGQGTYNPPTVGSSTNNFFVATDHNSFLFASNAPRGNLSDFGSTPASFGWRFTISLGPTVVPEADTRTMLALGLTPVALLAIARRRKNA